ncbi:carotenoid oxygenase family protein [Variovorax sp. RHLX14]|uniref:carotenoid oxygenase family protein n=1 Tax=Variovorax sp. RHLX14 TaxID=1259731 RepID=UPI003F46B8CC
MNRRELLRRLAVAGSLPALFPLSAHGSEPDSWQAQFQASTALWKPAFATTLSDLPLTAAVVAGRFPDAVAGTFYRNGPAGHELGGERYRHWFDGDGMVHRFVIESGQVHHQGRFIATTKRLAEQALQRRLTEGFGTMLADVDPVSSPDSMNVANINVLPIGGELLALWEGGSAIRLDPITLETRGLKTWRADLAGVPFSAHPRTDVDGTVWNFGVGSSSGLLVLYEIASNGALRRAEAFRVDDLPMIHDFAITAKHLVFLLPPLVYDVRRKTAGASFLDSHVWRPELGMRALVIDKRDWKRQQVFELPTGFFFHIGNAWEEETFACTTIHVDYMRLPDASSLLHSTREVMRGRMVHGTGSLMTVAHLNLGTGRATQNEWPIEAEFPRIDPRTTGGRHRHVVHAAQLLGGLPFWGAVARTDVESGASQRYTHGSQVLVEEHVFVPDDRGPGWILGTTLDCVNKQTVLSCFAADALVDGPVAQATLPYALPLGLHGTFVHGAWRTS